MVRVVRGLAALALLAVLLVGVPVLLWTAGSLPPLDPGLLLRPDDGTLVVGLLTVIGWLAWAAMVVLIVVEVINLIAGARIRLPGLAGPQRWAAAAVLAIAAMVVIAPAAHAAPDQGHDASAGSASVGTVTVTNDHTDGGRTDTGPMSPGAPESGPAARMPSESGSARHDSSASVVAPADRQLTVVEGDTLWQLAETHYGDPYLWPVIAEANPQLDDPDGLAVGMTLSLPVHNDIDPAAASGTEQDEVKEHRDAVTERRAALSETTHDDPDASAGGFTQDQPDSPDRPAVPPREAATVREAGTREAGHSLGTEQEQLEQGLVVEAATPWAVGTAALAGTTAAALAATIGLRRHRAAVDRTPGRRLIDPGLRARRVETHVRAQADPASAAQVASVLDEVSRYLLDTGWTRPPELDRLLVSKAELRLVFDEPVGAPPASWSVEGSTWVRPLGPPPATRADLRNLWPALVCVGWHPDGTLIMIDLLRFSLLNLGAAGAGVGADRVEGFRTAMMLELVTGANADAVEVIMVGGEHTLVDAIDEPQLRWVQSIDDLLPELRRRAHQRRNASPNVEDPATTEALRPVIMFCAEPLGPSLSQVATICDGQTAITAVLADEPGVPVLDVGSDQASIFGLDFHPQMISPDTRQGLLSLIETSRLAPTDPGWWWDHDHPPNGPARADSSLPGKGPDHDRSGPHVVSDLGPRRALAQPPTVAADVNREGAQSAPLIELLGPITLRHAAGQKPSRARGQCVEYAAWLLEHPAATAQQMAQGLLVAEGTRRSNMSRLRIWLGNDGDDEPYLPEAYSGRISLHPDVSSDFARLQALVIGGINRAPDSALVAALELVRGAPLADAAPGQWSWAEELRLDMVAVIRDAALVLAERALETGDLDVCRWASDQGMLATEDDEPLARVRLQLEHRMGNLLDAERLAMRLIRHARALGVDLAPETVTTIQTVMEGRPRRRA